MQVEAGSDGCMAAVVLHVPDKLQQLHAAQPLKAVLRWSGLGSGGLAGAVSSAAAPQHVHVARLTQELAGRGTAVSECESVHAGVGFYGCSNLPDFSLTPSQRMHGVYDLKVCNKWVAEEAVHMGRG